MDRFWLEALQAVKILAALHERVFGPQEFDQTIGGILPLEFTECFDAVTFFVTPKDDVDRISTKIIKRLEEFQCVFANEVFVAFSSLKEDKAQEISEDEKLHLPYFTEQVNKVLSGIPIRQNSFNPRYPVGNFDTANRGRRILIVNASNSGNFGDELLAAAAMKLCKQALPEAEIIVSGPSVDRSIIAKADHIVFGGGGALYEKEFWNSPHNTDLQNLANYFKFGYYAKEYGSTFSILGLGHQLSGTNTLTDAGRMFVKESLSNATAISARDPDTTKLLSALLPVGKKRIQDSEDLGFAFLEPLQQASSKTKRITFIGSSLASDQSIDATNAMLRMLNDKGCSIRIVIQANEDPILYDRLKRLSPDVPFQILDLRSLPLPEAIRIFSETDAIICGRFHAAVMALMAQIPILMLDYPGGKKERLARRLFGDRWNQIIFRPGMTPEEGEKRVEQLFTKSFPHLEKSFLNSLIASAQSNTGLLKEVFKTRLFLSSQKKSVGGNFLRSRAGQSHRQSRMEK